MFKQNLDVNNGVPSPSIPVTPNTSTPNTFGTPAMTPNTAPVESGGSPVSEQQKQDASTEQNKQLSVDAFFGGGEEGGEHEEDIIRRFSMQNLFNPTNALSNDGSSIVAWGTTPSTSALDTPSTTGFDQISTLSSSTVIGTPSSSFSKTVTSSSLSDNSDIQHQIAYWRSALGASPPIMHNVVATANLMVDLDLKRIALTARNAEYNPRRFSAVVMRIREPKSTALVFKSGKLVVTGTKTADEARQAARKFGRVIMKVGYPDAKFKDFKVENLVCTFTVPFPIHLEQFYKDVKGTVASYEPEVFPGLIYKTPHQGTLLIFVSGKCVMIGMKTQEAIDKAYLHILPLLDKYRKK